MDSRKFDNWTRRRALRLSRRDALRLAGISGASAALAAGPLESIAQTTCSLTLHGETGAGPSAPATFDGALQFSVGNDGVLSQASFTPTEGSPASVSGSLSGRAIDLSITLSPGQILVLSGATDQKGPTCPSAAAGILSGPQPGDLGAWQATGSGAPAAPSLTSVQQGSSGSSGQSSLSCPPPQSVCGPNCCPGGAACTNAAQGLCTCPSGTEQCGLNCVPSCAGGQSLDLDTCTCPEPEAACIQNQQSCQNHGQCCSGYCGGGTCFDCAGKVCGEFGCIDPSKDSQNCGNCGNVCILPQVCSNGVCGCAPDRTPCVSHSECCSQLCFVNTCTSCSDVSGGDDVPFTFGGEGICVDLRDDVDHCGSCFFKCPAAFGSNVCEAGVCHDINNDADFCGFGHVNCGPGKICRFGDCVTG